MPRLLKFFLGIDPGKEGGFARIEVTNNTVTDIALWRMPETTLSVSKLFQEDLVPCEFAILEQVSSSPQMGVTSAFTFGHGYGRLELGLMLMGIPHSFVRPQAWQKGLGFPIVPKEEKTAHKLRLRQFAQRLFPKLTVWNETIGLQNAVCDALLIAEYCRRTMGVTQTTRKRK